MDIAAFRRRYLTVLYVLLAEMAAKFRFVISRNIRFVPAMRNTRSLPSPGRSACSPARIHAMKSTGKLQTANRLQAGQTRRPVFRQEGHLAGNLSGAGAEVPADALETQPAAEALQAESRTAGAGMDAALGLSRRPQTPPPTPVPPASVLWPVAAVAAAQIIFARSVVSYIDGKKKLILRNSTRSG